MTKIYTRFSNYSEINIENREKNVEKEIGKWGNNSEKFVKYREEWEKASNENYLPSHPLHVDIELSDACNLRCIMCIHGFESNHITGTMDKEMVYRVIDGCAEIIGWCKN